MNPFLYPKAKHARKETPPIYKRYQPYKPYLQSEFDGKCIYCLMNDRIKSYAEFGVDHYRPQSTFPHLSAEYMNLFYSCNACNSFKGTFWPSSKQKRKGIFIPNPCEHVMFEHVKYHGEKVTHKTEAGRWTVELLQLNNDEVIEFRRYIRFTLKLYEEKIREGDKDIKFMEKKLGEAASIPKKKEIGKDLEQLERKVNKLKEFKSKYL